MKNQYLRIMKYVSLGVLLSLLGACAKRPVKTQIGEPKSELFYQTKSVLDQAVSERADDFSPKLYREAVKVYLEAEEIFEKGKSKSQIQEHLQETERLARKSIEVSQTMQNNFPQLIESRDKALTAGAERMNLKSFQQGEKLFLNTSSHVGEKEMEKARKLSEEGTKQYQVAELQAIQENVVGELNKQIQEAAHKGAKEWAPQTYQTALKHRDESLGILARDRYNIVSAQEQADQGAYFARKAEFLSKKIKDSKGDRANWEKMFLHREGDLQKIASSLQISPEFDEGFQEPVNEIDQAINELKQRELAYQNELRTKSQALAQAQQQARQAELARMQAQQQIRQEEAARERISSELSMSEEAIQKQREAQEKVKMVQKLFPVSEEAKITLDPANNITIVLRGLNFETGRSSIKPEHYALLGNVKQALEMFPDRKVIISGHTDFTGSSEFNKKLSLERAKSVMEYLKSVGINANQIEAVGLGEANPIAPNVTPAGRRMNRRIEVTILAPIS
jgi:outer membrane protein OmpA-like peptidoglycan-associated protein